jgi:hypothetical protein
MLNRTPSIQRYIGFLYAYLAACLECIFNKDLRTKFRIPLTTKDKELLSELKNALENDTNEVLCLHQVLVQMFSDRDSNHKEDFGSDDFRDQGLASVGHTAFNLVDPPVQGLADLHGLNLNNQGEMDGDYEDEDDEEEEEGKDLDKEDEMERARQEKFIRRSNSSNSPKWQAAMEVFLAFFNHTRKSGQLKQPQDVTGNFAQISYWAKVISLTEAYEIRVCNRTISLLE